MYYKLMLLYPAFYVGSEDTSGSQAARQGLYWLSRLRLKQTVGGHPEFGQRVDRRLINLPQCCPIADLADHVVQVEGTELCPVTSSQTPSE